MESLALSMCLILCPSEIAMHKSFARVIIVGLRVVAAVA
jgi:hypothetical protein